MKTPKILIADPQQEIIEHLSHFLVSQRYKVTGSATTPTETISLCRKTPFDLAFVAHMFKKDSGLELCAELHSILNNLYIIMMKPEVSEQDIVHAKAAHIKTFVTKPFTDCILLATINQFEITRRIIPEDT